MFVVHKENVMPQKPDDEDYLAPDTEPPEDDMTLRKFALSLPIAGHTDLSDVASAALEHADVIDQLFDDMFLPEASSATVITQPPTEDIIQLSEDDEDVILLDDDDVLLNEAEELADDEEEAFYRQFTKQP